MDVLNILNIVPPLVAESVIRRMNENNHYRPEAIIKLSEFRVLEENNAIEHYSNPHVMQFGIHYSNLQIKWLKYCALVSLSPLQVQSLVLNSPYSHSQKCIDKN
ncbi:hypothetical protein CC99x_004970 [Candidatus Berkiella cookevillensis]|nr:hypothetical protein [Candidatus Berkiella cookevillensis]MCS5708251.1 hypothetical protein [Candidatus Berkiella cookevillensis]